MNVNGEGESELVGTVGEEQIEEPVGSGRADESEEVLTIDGPESVVKFKSFLGEDKYNEYTKGEETDVTALQAIGRKAPKNQYYARLKMSHGFSNGANEVMKASNPSEEKDWLGRRKS